MARELILLWLILTISFANAATSQAEYNKRCATLNEYDRIKNDDKCQKYIECQADKKALIKDCPFGLAYDENTESCIWKSDVDRCNDGPPTEDPGCDQPDSSTPTCPDATFDNMRNKCTPMGTYVCAKGESVPKCSESEYDGNFIADKENCAGYFVCDDGISYRGTCPDGYYFDPAKQKCRHKDSPDLKDCKPVIGSSSSSSSSPDPSDIDWGKVCDGVKSKFVTDPRLCNAYIYCNDKGQPRQDFCDTGFYFSQGSCTKTPPNSCICEVYLEGSKDYNEYLPHTDKNKFYVCTKGDRQVKECKGNAVYDPTSKGCKM